MLSILISALLWVYDPPPVHIEMPITPPVVGLGNDDITGPWPRL
jgi:hypothetical protein